MKKCLIGLVFTLSYTSLYAQDPQTTANPTKLDYNIQTPNVASMSRYGNIPVSLFTGVPNINIPLYNIALGNHSFPISISYHASGIKVDDISSEVGLGFNLNATYSISRVLRGKPDEEGYVGNNDAAKIVKTNSTQSSVSTRDTFRASAENIIDTEPDEFNFNIGSASGKFVMAPDKIIVMPDQDIKVEYDPADYFFTLTDAKGIKYYFNDASVSSSIGCGDSPGTTEYNSSWSISKIIYPDTNDSLVFNYITEFLELVSNSQSNNYDYPPGYAPYPVRGSYCSTTSSILEKKISSIIFPKGKINFAYNTLKLEISDASNPSRALDYFEIKDKQNNVTQRTNFSYSYYNNTSVDNLGKKLKLDSLYTTYPNGTISNKHKFEYNGTNIPSYKSMSKDHWGYNNGASNSSLIPGNTFTLHDGTGMPFIVPGGDREVHADKSVGWVKQRRLDYFTEAIYYGQKITDYRRILRVFVDNDNAWNNVQQAARLLNRNKYKHLDFCDFRMRHIGVNYHSPNQQIIDDLTNEANYGHETSRLYLAMASMTVDRSLPNTFGNFPHELHDDHNHKTLYSLEKMYDWYGCDIISLIGGWIVNNHINVLAINANDKSTIVDACARINSKYRNSQFSLQW